MIQFAYALIVSMVLSSNLSAQMSQSGTTVINLAGKQRMLTQKMSKEALLIIKGIEVEKNQADLQKTITLFDKTLHGLRNGDEAMGLPPTQDPQILKQLDQSIKLWHLFEKFLKQVVEGRVDQNTLKAVEMANMPLLEMMNKTVHQYETLYESSLSPNLAKTINLAGRERMLIQKMTKELLLIANHVESDTFIKSLQGGGNLFHAKLSELMQDLETIKDPKLVSQLKEVQRLWKEYQEIILNTELSSHGAQHFNKKEKEMIQKMSRELVAVAKRIDEQHYQIHLGETEELFDSTLKALIHGDTQLGITPTKDPTIQEALHRVEELWQEYRPIIVNVDTSPQALRKAMEINMPLLQAMDKVVKLYEAQP